MIFTLFNNHRICIWIPDLFFFLLIKKQIKKQPNLGNRREIPANIERALGRLVNLAGFDIKIYATPPCPVLRDG